MNALLIDDEALARLEMRNLLQLHPEIKVVGEAANVNEALARVEEYEPDLIFLDINMPGGDGFSLIERLPLPHPYVIFTTAYSEYALRAFEANALDYLTKPVEPERLAKALNKLNGRMGNIGGASASGDARDPVRGGRAESVLSAESKVFLKDGERCWFVEIKDIRLLEADESYTRVIFGQAAPLLARPLKSLEPRLPKALFLRANRNQIINLQHIASVEPWFSGSLMVHLKGGEKVEFSRRHTKAFKDEMGL